MNKNFSNLLGSAIANKNLSETSIREQIVIRQELKELIPPLADDELLQLEENILKEGIRDPIMLWPVDEKLILIDGHNRFAISQKHNLEFPFKKIEFKNEEEVKDWMVKNQLGRRNLTPEQQSYLRGLRYNREKTQGKRSDLTLDQNDPKSNSESTAITLGKEYNVSEATIKRDGEFAAGLEIIGEQNPELKKEILKGHSKVSKQEIRALSKKSKSPDKIKAKRKADKLSPEQIASIAFDFIKTESRTLSQVCNDFAEDESQVKPIDFFKMWAKRKGGN